MIALFGIDGSDVILLLIDKMNLETTRMRPFKYLVEIIFALTRRVKVLLPHKLPNPLITIYNLNPSH